jgi:uncharacterized protein (TIGR03435 family)
MKVMLQALLEERFKLKLHQETRDSPVYRLVVAKGGPKLATAKDEQGNIITALPPREDKSLSPEEQKKFFESALTPGLKGPSGSMSERYNGLNMELSAPAASMQSLARYLSSILDRRVIDHTATAGLYDIMIRYALRPQTQGKISMVAPTAGIDALRPGEAPGIPVPSLTGPTIFTALEEQLGLKLEADKGPLEYFVIDSIEKPSEN